MKHYLQPTLKAKPSHLIIHVGTNDLYEKFPDEIAQDNAELGKTATKQVPGTDLNYWIKHPFEFSDPILKPEYLQWNDILKSIKISANQSRRVN